MKEIWEKYKGAIIGGLIAIFILASDLAETVFYVLVVGGAIILGNYVHKNKEEVKEKLKDYIDKF